MLTIAIPTFNRHEKLLKTLNNLYLFKGKFPIIVLIIDNFSTPPVSEYLAEKKYSGFDYTKIYRNNGNIGASANLLLSFVYAVSDWMWLLGDDDLPLSNCLNSIFNEIEKAHENDFLIKFNSPAGDFPDFDTTISNEKEFIKFCTNFRYYSNMLFISNSIFRVNSMQRNLHIMFEYTNTLAPHIIGILKNVSQNKCIKIVNNLITEHGITEEVERKWDTQHRIREGVLYFTDLKDHGSFKTEMARNLFNNYFSTKRFFTSLFAYPFKHKNYSIDYWHWFYWKSSFLFSGIKSAYLLFLSMTIKYYFNSRLINTILSKRIKSNTISNLE
jgi:hypothetical protein